MKLEKINEKLDKILVKASLKACSGKKGFKRERCIIRNFVKEFKIRTKSALEINLSLLNKLEKSVIEEIFGLGNLKRILAHIHKSYEIIKKIEKRALLKLKVVEEKEARKIGREFLGRACSVIKKMKKSIREFNEFCDLLKEIPEIKDEKTVLITGMPNSGKTTLLNELAKTKAKVASYAFTTKKLNLGYVICKSEEIQLVDTPGLLDREFEKMNKIEKKALAALKSIADCALFLLDASESSGSLEEQVNLLLKIKNLEPKTLVIITKADIASGENITKAKKILKDKGFEFVIKGECNIKEELCKFIHKDAP